MMYTIKPFLLIFGENYYPEARTNDWKGCFSSIEEAKKHLETLLDQRYPKDSYSERDRGSYTYHEIVDLREWMNK